MAPVVTLSATYGAYGDKIGPAVADRLDLPFLDRAIPPSAAHELAQSTDIAESLDEPVPSRWERLAMGFANAAMPVGPSHATPGGYSDPRAVPSGERGDAQRVGRHHGGGHPRQGGHGRAGQPARRPVRAPRRSGRGAHRASRSPAARTSRTPVRRSGRWTGRAMRSPGSSSTFARTIPACTTSFSTAPSCRWTCASMSSCAPVWTASARILSSGPELHAIVTRLARRCRCRPDQSGSSDASDASGSSAAWSDCHLFSQPPNCLPRSWTLPAVRSRNLENRSP